MVDTNILFRYFVGLSLTDDIPDRTLLGKFRARLGENKFNQIFNQIVRLASQVGLVDNRLRLIDCSAVKAKVDLYRCRKASSNDGNSSNKRQRKKQNSFTSSNSSNNSNNNNNSNNSNSNNSNSNSNNNNSSNNNTNNNNNNNSNKNNSNNNNSKNNNNNNNSYLYYLDQNTTDPEASVGHKTKKNKWYGYKSGIIMDAESEIVTAVKTTTAKIADTNHLEDLVIQDKNISGGAKRICGDKGFLGHDYFLSQNNITNNIIRRDNMKKPRRLIYYLDKAIRPIIEHKFAEGKKYHGLAKARYRGRWRVHIQSLLIYLTMNLKKIVNYLCPITSKT